LSILAHSKKAIAAANRRLTEDAWLEQRDNEMWAINNTKFFKPITIVVRDVSATTCHSYNSLHAIPWLQL